MYRTKTRHSLAFMSVLLPSPMPIVHRQSHPLIQKISMTSISSPPNALRKYLQETKVAVERTAHVILGNEAADIDSIACAIALAFAWRGKDKQSLVPVANIPRTELPLRRDAQLALSIAGLSAADLVFIDELPGGLEAHVSNGALSLVDHNVLASHQGFASANVVAIVDHHKDERFHLSANPRIIEKVGSCATLVADLLSSGDNRDVARLLLCAILLDTSNLRALEKTTQRDVSAVAKLQKLAEWDEKELYEIHRQLKNARFDISGFDVRDMLRRDLKTLAKGGLRVAIASIGLRPDEFAELTEKQSLDVCFQQFAKEKKVDCVLTLMSHSTDGARQRHLAVMTGQVGDALQRELFRDGKGDVGLHRCEVEKGNGLWWFQLKDARMSRKIVAPAVSQALENVATSLG